MIFRLTQNLNTKIKAGPMAVAPLDENPYADWSARLFTADRTQYILISNTRALYSTVMYGRGITRDDQFIERALSSLREYMGDDGLQFMYEQFVAPASSEVRFCKTLNRSVTGSMNEMVAEATMLLVDGDLSPYDASFRLNEMPLSVLNYAMPREAFKRME